MNRVENKTGNHCNQNAYNPKYYLNKARKTGSTADKAEE